MVSDPDTLGAELAAARLRRELTLDQVERQTRIRAYYLAALEDNDYALLPSAVQARGFLRNYARFLGLDAEACERRFNAAVYASARRGRAPAVFADDPTLLSPTSRTPTGRPASLPGSVPTSRSGSRATGVSGTVSSPNADSIPESSRRRINGQPPPARPDDRGAARRSRTRNMTLGTLAIFGVTLIVLSVIVLYATHSLGGSAPPSPILSPLPATETPTVSPSPTMTLTPDRPSPLPNPAANALPTATGGLALQLTVRERAPLRISIDDQVVYSGVPAANTVLKYQAKTSIQIHAGDAGAIDIAINGVPQPPIGEVHAIADKTYTLATISGGPTVAVTPPAAASSSPGK